MKDREELGRLVRAIWVEWAKENSPKPHHLWPWEELPEDLKEVDRRIGERLFRLGMMAARLGYAEDVHIVRGGER